MDKHTKDTLSLGVWGATLFFSAGFILAASEPQAAERARELLQTGQPAVPAEEHVLPGGEVTLDQIIAELPASTGMASAPITAPVNPPKPPPKPWQGRDFALWDAGL